MNYCKKCGAKLRIENKFCPKCGTPVQSLTQGAGDEKPSTDARQDTVGVSLKKPSGIAGTSSDRAERLQPITEMVSYEPYRGKSIRSRKKLIGAAACIALIAGMAAVSRIAGEKDSADSMESMQQYASELEDTYQPEDAAERERRLLEEQRRQQQEEEDPGLGGQQGSREEYLEEERRQEELLEEERRRQEELLEEENKVYVSEYEVVVADVTWKEAKRQAEERGGHLAVITSQEEQREIEALVDQYDYVHTVWLGGKYKNGKFRWLNQEDFDYTNWGPGEPNNETGDEFFMDMYEVHDIWYWNDVPNDIQQYYSGKMGYVIEWEIEQ